MDVSKNIGTPQIIHFKRVFHYKPSILGYPSFWKHPYTTSFTSQSDLSSRGGGWLGRSGWHVGDTQHYAMALRRVGFTGALRPRRSWSLRTFCFCFDGFYIKRHDSMVTGDRIPEWNSRYNAESNYMFVTWCLPLRDLAVHGRHVLWNSWLILLIDWWYPWEMMQHETTHGYASFFSFLGHVYSVYRENTHGMMIKLWYPSPNQTQRCSAQLFLNWLKLHPPQEVAHS